MTCPSCNAEVLDIDVKCPHCGHALAATGAHQMIGQKLLGVYELVDVLGQGGMSVVFKGKHTLTDQEVALKILPPELAAHSQVKGRFLEEAKALAALDHPNIVHLYNFGQENGSFVLAMQYVQGVTWERMILENKRLDWKTSVRITVDVLRALEYAHGRGVVHRDMKPSNVLVRRHDGTATVMDFGIAKMAQSTRLTATGQTMGTVRYMSPEQVRGQDVDLRTDLYSLGATLYESLVGDTPFDGNTHFEIMTKHLSEPPKRPSQLGIEVPPLVEDAMMRVLAKRAEDRFDDARDWRKILEAALKEGDVGLLETQRVDRKLLEITGKPVSATTAPSAATAIADSLEPAPSRTYKRPPSKLPYYLLAVLVLAGAVLGTLLILKKHNAKPDAYKPTMPVAGLTAGQQFGSRLVETDASMTPAELERAYSDALRELRTFHTAGSAVEIPDPTVDELVAIPRNSFCDPGLFASVAKRRPADCHAVGGAITLAPTGAHVLVVVGEKDKLAQSMRAAVKEAVCYFAATEDVESCTVAEDWLKSHGP